MATLVLDIMEGSIVGVRTVTNPDKLARLSAQLLESVPKSACDQSGLLLRRQ